MKITMLVYAFWPEVEGGAERQCRKISVALAALGHQVEVWTRWPGPGFAFKETMGSVVIRRFGLFTPIFNAIVRLRAVMQKKSGGVPSIDLSSAPHVASKGIRLLAPFRWLNRFSFMAEIFMYAKMHPRCTQVIHVHESHWIAGLAVQVGRMLKIPVICKEATFPALMPLPRDVPFAHHIESLRREAFFVATTNFMRRSLEEQGIVPQRIGVVPNGVDISQEAADPAVGLNVLCVANLSQGGKVKAFDVLIQAWIHVIQAVPDAVLEVVGRGYPSPWRELAEKSRCANSVRFVTNARSVDHHYRKAAVFVLPSRREGLSNALLEAQSWGLPAVVSDIPGNRAVVENEINGVLVPVGDAEALAEAVTRLLRDPALRFRMGREARRRIQYEFSIESVAQRLSALYQSVLANRHEEACKERQP